MRTIRFSLNTISLALTFLFIVAPVILTKGGLSAQDLKITWEKNILMVRGDFPGKEIEINYLEAYCRPGSTDRDWSETVIPHKTEKTFDSRDGREIQLRDRLADGVEAKHVIKSGKDFVSFEIEIQNPTEVESAAHWAQPCIRIDKFTGFDRADSRLLKPPYIEKCFLFVDDKLTRLPTTPWAEKARYVPGQVYCPKEVDRNDVNPRPLSSVIPSSSLCGCFSSDDSMIFAVAFEPCQEIFQGVITCFHNDFRVGGLKPGETKNIKGMIYIIPASESTLRKRFAADFNK